MFDTINALKVSGLILLTWVVYVSEPASVQSMQTGQTYMVWQWVAKDRFIHKDFCESKAKEYRRLGQQATCQYVND